MKNSSYRKELCMKGKRKPSDKGSNIRNRIRNLIEGTRQEEGRLFTKNIGVSEENIRSIDSEFCPVLACERGNWQELIF